jgi:hypothetical protein
MRPRAQLIAAFKRDHWAYVQGYEGAADMLVESLKSTWTGPPPPQPGKLIVWDDSRSPGYLVYPILLLCRHALELNLKGFNQAFGNAGTSGHNLQRLWGLFKESLAGIVERDKWPEIDPAALSDAEGLVAYFHALDPSGDFFRYADSKAGVPRTPFDIEELVNRRCFPTFAFLSRLREDFSNGPPWTWEE